MPFGPDGARARPGLAGALGMTFCGRAKVSFAGHLVLLGGDTMAFARTAKTNEIAPGTIREFQVEGKAVALANVGGKYYAINNTCLHRGGPLGQGVLNGAIVTCPWHGWEYDVTTGKVKQNPAVGVDCYRVEVRGEDIYVDAG
jgi:nitrite reductase/ring-hydroxylating ferredoxin subunit